jgi:hypothetical protein
MYIIFVLSLGNNPNKQNKIKQMETLTKTNLLQFSNFENYSFAEDFATIINDKAEDYDRLKDYQENLKGFLEDLRYGGCMSGIIGEFIYHSDCKDFYIKHIDDLEEFKNELEDNLGEKIENRNDLPRYSFIVWLCFEEFANDIYNTIFEA